MKSATVVSLKRTAGQPIDGSMAGQPRSPSNAVNLKRRAAGSSLGGSKAVGDPISVEVRSTKTVAKISEGISRYSKAKAYNSRKPCF